jgi:hypothetical protein
MCDLISRPFGFHRLFSHKKFFNKGAVLNNLSSGYELNLKTDKNKFRYAWLWHNIAA